MVKDTAAFDLTALEGELQGEAAEDAGGHNVHIIASQANEIEQSVEQFLDEALIADVSSAVTSAEADETLLDRREARERQRRVEDRAHELLREAQSKERHDQELRELSDAISASKQPAVPEKGAAAGTKAPKPKNERVQRKAYMADLTQFIGQSEASSKLSSLQEENELLKRCLQDARNPKAFSKYLGAKTTL